VSGLTTAVTTLVGGLLGVSAGFIGAAAWGDMRPYSLQPFVWMAGGATVGALAGSYVAGAREAHRCDQ
jgi:hypothetical protein